MPCWIKIYTTHECGVEMSAWCVFMCVELVKEVGQEKQKKINYAHVPMLENTKQTMQTLILCCPNMKCGRRKNQISLCD